MFLGGRKDAGLNTPLPHPLRTWLWSLRRNLCSHERSSDLRATLSNHCYLAKSLDFSDTPSASVQSEDNNIHLLGLLRLQSPNAWESLSFLPFPMSEILTHEKVSLFLALQTEHDDCGSGQHNCDENAICTNTVQGHSCTCKPGYVGNGTICRGRLAALGARLPVSCSPARVIGAPITGPLCLSGD